MNHIFPAKYCKQLWLRTGPPDGATPLLLPKSSSCQDAKQLAAGNHAAGGSNFDTSPIKIQPGRAIDRLRTRLALSFLPKPRYAGAN